MKKHLIFLIISLFSIYYSYSQGTVRGKITDENGEALIGATIMLKLQRTTGTITDYDGNYSLKISDLSPQPIVISYIGYQSIEDTVNPQKNEVIIRNFVLIASSSQIGEVKVIGKAVRAKESYMEQIKMRSAASLDFISAETIKRTGDASVSSAVSRITGVSTFGGFITVRGIGDRYVKTTINGSRIPTLDPFTNNIKLDLFQASLVDNIVVTKTASADLPGDWAGAYLSVETKDYPEKLTVSMETAMGYNSQSTFNDVVSSNRSATDWLGCDNGYRNINHQESDYFTGTVVNLYGEFAGLGLKDYFNEMGITENTAWNDTYTKLALVQLGFLGEAQMNDPEAYTIALAQYNASDLKQQGLIAATADVVKVGQSLPNTWLTINRKAPVDFSQSFSIGNQVNFLNKPMGYLFGFRYSNSTLYDKNGFAGKTTNISLADTITSLDNIYDEWSYVKTSTETNGWSALMNIAYKLNPNNSISFLFMPNLIGVNKARIGKRGNNYELSQYYESRRQMVYQIKTEHYLPALKMKIEMNASYTEGKSNSPDFRHLFYSVNPLSIQLASIQSSNFRMFNDLSENFFDSHFTAELPLGKRTDLIRKIKFGGAYQKIIRNTDQHFYYLPVTFTPSAWGDSTNNIGAALNTDNFGLVDGKVNLYYVQESGPEYNTIGFSHNLAGFMMADYMVVPSLRLYAGLRVESAHLHTDIADSYERQLAFNDDRRLGIKPGIRDEIFYLPSASIIYHLKRDNQAPVNVRFSYSQTMALPSLRELTPYRVYDYSLMGRVTGNVALKPVNISNYDIRFEAYFKSGDNISASLFYKKFENHIEMVREVSDMVYYSWQNARKSDVIGIELEGRIGITKSLEFRANTTVVSSKTKLKNAAKSRTMYGQSPYIINVLLSYTSDKLGFMASVSYNVQGPKLVISGNYGAPDVFELPRHLLDAKLSKTLGKRFSVSLKIRDMLNTSTRRAYKFPNRWIDFDRFTYGTTYTFGISCNLK